MPILTREPPTSNVQLERATNADNPLKRMSVSIQSDFGLRLTRKVFNATVDATMLAIIVAAFIPI